MGCQLIAITVAVEALLATQHYMVAATVTIQWHLYNATITSATVSLLEAGGVAALDVSF